MPAYGKQIKKKIILLTFPFWAPNLYRKLQVQKL